MSGWHGGGGAPDPNLLSAQRILAETFDRRCSPVFVGSYASGTVRAAAIYLPAGVVVGQLGLCIGTAGVGISAARLGLYDAASNLLAQTADMTAAFQAIAWQMAALGAPYTVLSSGLYYLACFQTYATSAALMVADNPAGVNNAREGIGAGARMGWKQLAQVALPNPAVPTESGFTPLLVATA